MTVALEGPRRIGEARVAALTERRVRGTGGRGYAVFSGEKHPLAILIRVAGETRLYPIDPRAASWEAVETLYPGAAAAMMG